MFVIQYYIGRDGFTPGTWETFCEYGQPKRYNTLDEAQKAFRRLGIAVDCRIAEEYTVTRYKAVKSARLRPQQRGER